MGIVILQSKNVSSQHIVHRKLTQSHGSIIFNKNNFENRIVRNFTGSSPCVCMCVHLDEPRPPISCSHGRYYGTPPLGARSLGPHTYLPSALVPPLRSTQGRSTSPRPVGEEWIWGNRANHWKSTPTSGTEARCHLDLTQKQFPFHLETPGKGTLRNTFTLIHTSAHLPRPTHTLAHSHFWIPPIAHLYVCTYGVVICMLIYIHVCTLSPLCLGIFKAFLVSIWPWKLGIKMRLSIQGIFSFSLEHLPSVRSKYDVKHMWVFGRYFFLLFFFLAALT